MPIIKSAKKRVRVARKATVRNAKTQAQLFDCPKLFESTVTGSSHSKAQSALDKAAKKGLLHKNKVARKKKPASRRRQKSRRKNRWHRQESRGR